MERVLVFVVLGAVAVVVALVLNRRRPEAPTRTGYAVPEQLDRADFARPAAPWLVALFTSSTCQSCARAKEVARPLDSAEVVVHEAELATAKDLHERYAIDAVPTIVVADAEGVVRASFLGPPTAADLWATLAELRDPGSVPPGCDHGAGEAGAPTAGERGAG